MSIINAQNRFVPAELHDPEWYPFDKESPMYFKVEEYPLNIESKVSVGSHMHVDGYKALVRKHGDRPVVLAVVGDGYKVVQNKELFNSIENMLLRSYTRHELEGVKVHDRMARHGAYCLREYILPNINVRIDEQSRALYRIIAFNGFGTTAFKLITGAIDAWCINGMIIGEHATWYRRHTGGLQIEDIVERLRITANEFVEHANMWRQWKNLVVTDTARVLDFLSKHYSERASSVLIARFEHELRTRGSNLWALYSALTWHATHHTVRRTKEDGEAITRIQRERHVAGVINAPEWMKLAA